MPNCRGGVTHWCQLNVKPLPGYDLIQNHVPPRSALPHPSFADAKRPLPVNGEGIEGWGKMPVE